MKASVIVFSLVLLASCSHMDYENMYSADTARKYKCEGNIMPASYNNFETYSDENLKEFERTSGYSECSRSNEGKDVFTIECKKPLPYKLITTTKQALCHKFMSDNKIL